MGTGQTVGEAMLHHPTVHPAGLTVGAARTIFRDHARTHLLLLVDDGRLVAAVDRGDLPVAASDDEPAAPYGALEGRTVGPDVAVDPLRESMAGSGVRRLAVVDAEGTLLGLLCLKRSLTGFCTDEGVASMRAEREQGAPREG